VFCLCLSALESVRLRQYGPILGGAAAITLGLALAAVKLHPMLAFMAQHERTFVVHHAKGFNPLAMSGWKLFYDAFLFPGYNTRLPFEDGAYLGVIPVALAVLGVFVGARRRWPWYVTGGVFMLVAMGDRGVPGLWSSLKHLPVLQQTIFPQRYLFGALLPMMVAAAEGLGWLDRRFGRSGRILSLALVALTLADLTAHNFTVYRDMFGTVPPAVSWTGPLRGQARAPSEYEMLGLYRAGFGILNAHPYLPHPAPHALAHDDPAYRGELFAAGGTVSLVSWTPNVVRVQVEPTSGPTHVVLNQNASAGWHADGAQSAVDPGSLTLAFNAAANGVVTVRYRPPLFRAGLAVTIATLVACVVLAARPVLLRGASSGTDTRMPTPIAIRGGTHVAQSGFHAQGRPSLSARPGGRALPAW